MRPKSCTLTTYMVALCVLALLAGCNTTRPGVALMEGGNFQGAIAEFQKELEANPEDWQAREMLGYAYLKSGDNQKAVRELEQVIAKHPKEASMSYVFLGLAQLNLDDQEAALATWRRFDDPDKPEVRAEIDRLTTLVELENSKKLARQALAGEGKRSVAATKENSIAVFNFAIPQAGENMLPLQKALTAMTISDLAQVKGVSVIERTRLQALVDELRLGESGAVDAATAPRAGRMLGADRLVVGSMSDKAQKLGVASTIASTVRGGLVGSFGLDNDKAKFFELQKEVVANILKSSGITLDKDSEIAILGKPHTRSLKATILYGQGLDAQDRQDWAAAKNYFEQAAKEDPGFMMARLARDRMPIGVSIRVGGGQKVSSVASERVEKAYAAQTNMATANVPFVIPASTMTAPTVTPQGPRSPCGRH